MCFARPTAPCLRLRAVTQFADFGCVSLVRSATAKRPVTAKVVELIQGRPELYRLEGSLKLRFGHVARTEEALFARVEQLLEALGPGS